MSTKNEYKKHPLTDSKEDNIYGLNIFKNIDHLPKLFNHISSEQQSSYSRDGGNADGFGMSNHAGPNKTGEPNEEVDTDNRILLSLNQPGVIYRMWFTTWDPTLPRLRIYIDGETEPSYDLNINELGSGEFPPFTGSLVYDQQASSGGIVSYVPIVFKESIKVIGSGYFYYNINYQKYPHGTILNEDDYQTGGTEVDRLFANVGSDPKETIGEKGRATNVELKPNETITIYETNEKQMVTSLSVNFNDLQVRKFERDEHEDAFIIPEGRVSYTVGISAGKESTLVFKGALKGHDQTANVEVTDESGNPLFSGELLLRNKRLNGFEWRDSEYFDDAFVELPSFDTKIENVTVSVTGEVEIYEMRVVEGNTIVDVVDFGDESNRASHQFEGNFSSGVKRLEYDPNTLIPVETWQEIYAEEDIINQVFIRVTYPDKGEAVYAPVSSFFGFGAFGLFETLSLMVGLKDDGTMYSYYPMPFEAGVKIELVNNSNHKFSHVATRVSYADNPLTEGTYGYFKAHYVENLHDTPTELVTGEPITFIDIKGQGLIAGITHSMSAAYRGEHSRFYLEGDEQIYVDGSLSHSFHGTGTEDFYNGGWYFKTGVQTTPLFGQSNHNYRDNRDRTVMLRTLLPDPIYFRSHIDFKMEHGGWNESEKADVFGVVYYYHLEEPSIVQTEGFILSSSKDTTRVGYQVVGGQTKHVPEGTRYEGFYDKTANGYKTTEFTEYQEISDYSTFVVAIDPKNSGVILRREYLMKQVNQQANVYVDGGLVGMWHSSFRNAYDNYVRQDDFYIPATFTEGKEKITVKIEVITNHESRIWTESMYQVFSIKA